MSDQYRIGLLSDLPYLWTTNQDCVTCRGRCSFLRMSMCRADAPEDWHSVVFQTFTAVSWSGACETLEKSRDVMFRGLCEGVT